MSTPHPETCSHVEHSYKSANEVTLDFEGRPVIARVGETLAAALLSAGIIGLRDTARGERRGLFCGMGVCNECLVSVDSRQSQRACMTKVSGPHTVHRQTLLPNGERGHTAFAASVDVAIGGLE